MRKTDFLKCIKKIVANHIFELVQHAKILRINREYPCRLLTHLMRDRILVRYFLCTGKVSRYTANICICASNVLL